MIEMMGKPRILALRIGVNLNFLLISGSRRNNQIYPCGSFCRPYTLRGAPLVLEHTLQLHPDLLDPVAHFHLVSNLAIF